MIRLEKSKCTGCGLCSEICHERCLRLVETESGDLPEIDHSVCSGCTQCISVCPRQAIYGDGLEPTRYERDLLPSSEQLEEFFKERRTVRRFKGKEIGNETLIKLAAIGKHSPTNNYDLRLIIVTDPDIIRFMDDVIMREIRWLYRFVFRSDLTFRLLSALTPKVNAKVRVKIAHGVQEGTCMPTLPAAVVLVVGDRRVLLSEVSAHYALYTMILYAQSLGIGSRINASGLLNLDRSKSLRKRLGLAQEESILAMVEMGYPSIRFGNKVEGRQLPLQWNDQAFHAE